MRASKRLYGCCAKVLNLVAELVMLAVSLARRASPPLIITLPWDVVSLASKLRGGWFSLGPNPEMRPYAQMLWVGSLAISRRVECSWPATQSLCPGWRWRLVTFCQDCPRQYIQQLLCCSLWKNGVHSNGASHQGGAFLLSDGLELTADFHPQPEISLIAWRHGGGNRL